MFVISSTSSGDSSLRRFFGDLLVWFRRRFVIEFFCLGIAKNDFQHKSVNIDWKNLLMYRKNKCRNQQYSPELKETAAMTNIFLKKWALNILESYLRLIKGPQTVHINIQLNLNHFISSFDYQEQNITIS